VGLLIVSGGELRDMGYVGGALKGRQASENALLLRWHVR